MFLDVKELAVRKLRIRKKYAPGSIDFHSAEIKQIKSLEVTATAELLESQIRIEGSPKRRSNWCARAAWNRSWKMLAGPLTCFTLPCRKKRSPRKTG